MGVERANPLNTSIVRKQIISLTGLLQSFFIIAHLSGNLLLYGGSEVYNGYADILASQANVLWVLRAVLFIGFAVHVFFGISLYLENRRARGSAYKVSGHFGETTYAKKTMVLSGLLIFFFLWLHIVDFALGPKEGAAATVAGTNGPEDLGLYGLVWNSFLFSINWWRPVIYLGVVCFLGMHMSHGIQSVFQSLGLRHERFTPWLERISVILGCIVALGFGSLPVYVNIVQTPPI
jgi:succinate dehydrogenase / fumarate reductase cytochrome b subunit